MRNSGLLVITTVLAVGVGSSATAFAQRVQAVPGRPFGAAHISLPLPVGSDSFTLANGFEIHEPNGRVFYPAIDVGRFGEIASEFLGADTSFDNRLKIDFLFVGDAPFEVTVYTPEPQRVLVTPTIKRPRQHLTALMRWWRAYNAQVRAQEEQGDYPPLVETYLTEMLSRRLGLQLPLLSRRQEEQTELQRISQLLLGSEELRTAVVRETMRGGGGLGEPADIPSPAEIEWQPIPVPENLPPVKTEPIAHHVPQECFYIRFGSFQNFLWLQHLQDDYGGDIGRMVTLRGHDAHLAEKIKSQLALKQSATAELLGPQIISDIALVGRDLYLREGAALGVLFEATNNFALSTSFNSERSSAAAANNGAKLETVSVAGHDVSFLSTPDNRLRSYYAVDGNYHLVTTSRAIVERFYEAGTGKNSLGTSAEFQHARLTMPLDREDTIFAYFSSAFFRSLLGPLYQIELSRRLRSVTNMELLQLAKLAAAAEGAQHANVSDLVNGGFLPATFLQLSVDELPNATGDNFIDPQRGARGTFTPIPDVPLTGLTRYEADLYNRAAQFLQAHWPQADPLKIGVKRYALEGERMERVVIDANVSPLVEEKYGWVLSMVGPPTDVLIESNPKDVISLQMTLQGGLLWPDIPPHHLVVGIQDAAVGSALVPSGFLETVKMLRSTPGYLGAWPQLGVVDRIPFIPKVPDANGITQLPLGLWRWQGGGFSLLSFDPNLLLAASGFLRPVPTENPAQIRLHVRDLARSQLANWVSGLNYSRAYQASLGNVRLLNMLSQQLRVPKGESLKLANSMLDTQLVCTLRGEYQLKETNGLRIWRSTNWPETDQLPIDYRAPLLEWFRGATAEFTKFGDRAVLHAEIDMERKEPDAKVKLPLFNLFGGEKKEARKGAGDGAEQETRNSFVE